MEKWLWRTILGYVFLRPFVSEITFGNLDLIFSNIFLLVSLVYLYKKPKKLSENTSFEKVVLVFFISLLVSIAFSANFLNSLNELYKYLYLLILFYIARISDSKNRKQLIMVLLISACLVSLYSLYCSFIVSKQLLEYLSKYNTNNYAQEFLARKRAFAPFMSPNILAGYSIMTIMLSLGIVSQKIKQKKKDYLFLASTICLSLGTLTLLLTKSVGGWLVFAVSLFIFLNLGKISNKKTVLALALAIFLLATIFINRTQGSEHFTKPFFSLNKRLSYWRKTTKIIHQHPLGGIGLGNFWLKETRAAHNSYLQLWAEGGILGIISWLVLVFLFIKKGLRNSLSKKETYYKLGVFLSGISFLLHNLIDFSFFIPQAAFLWWIMLGLTQEEDAVA